MPLTDKFTEAMELARLLHRDQRRRGTEVTYMAHLLGVCALVLNDGGSEDQAIAALLHDSVEDHPEKISFDQIGQRFGKAVQTIVEACTEPPLPASGPALTWLDQKLRYVEHIRRAPQEARHVILADKLDNARLLEFAEHCWGDAYWTRFAAPTRQEMAAYQEALLEALSGWMPGELYREYRRLTQKIKA